MMMNIVKKIIVAVSIVSIISEMSMPLQVVVGKTALSTENNCNHKVLLQKIESVVISTDQHTFSYTLDIDDDGEDELIVKTCDIVTTENFFVYSCRCGEVEVRDASSVNYVTTHSEADNPYHKE